jgi:hypothetical protein
MQYGDYIAHLEPLSETQVRDVLEAQILEVLRELNMPAALAAKTVYQFNTPNYIAIDEHGNTVEYEHPVSYTSGWKLEVPDVDERSRT